MSIQTCIITISDRSSQGIRPDRSGPAISNAISSWDWNVVDTKVIPDEIELIVNTLIECSDCGIYNLILTTGGTGFSPRDLTPEATRKVVERFAPGLDEVMRAEGRKYNPHAMLSRGISGIRKSTLIINLPGNPKAALENLEAIKDIIPHAIALLNNLPGTEQEHQSLRKNGMAN